VKRVLITRPGKQAEPFTAGLRAAGFIPISFPVIEIRPMEDSSRLDSALGGLYAYDWVVFTSVNGVEMAWERMDVQQIEFPVTLRAAAIGPKTAAALKSRGIKPFFVPEEYIAEAILPGLGDLRGKRVLLLRAEIARESLALAIRAAGGVADEIATYRTLQANPDTAGLEAIRQGVDVVTLTSPSTVTHFNAILRDAGLDPRSLPGNPLFACIGPITTAAAERARLPNLHTAATFTSEGLIELLQKISVR
jgi:uroporphyrinogen III methyltransferase / synthase